MKGNKGSGALDKQIESGDDILDMLMEELPEEPKPVKYVDARQKAKERIKTAEEKRKKGVKAEIVSSPSLYPGSFSPITNTLPVPPSVTALASQTPLGRALINPLENDKLLDTVRSSRSTSILLRSIMEEIAEEAAYIKVWRNEHYGTGEDLSEATFKRIKMLKHLVETVMEQEKVKRDNSSGKVDFHGESFQRVLKHFLETMQKTFKKVNIPIQYEDIFFTQLAKDFDGFEKTAERLYYGKE
jgi:hypothetical protein